MLGTYPGFMTIAEESTAWPKVTGDIEDEGLGFSFKWNMGWMHDFCEYMKFNPDKAWMPPHPHGFRPHGIPLTRKAHWQSGNSLEVVHLKCSMVNKMPGYQVDKYANLRVGYTYMFGHCGSTSSLLSNSLYFFFFGTPTR